MMAGALSLRLILTIGIVVITQVGAASLLVRTNGFRDPVWTAACLGIYVVSFYFLADAIRRGMALSLVMPILAALVPLATIVVAVTFLGEQASWARIGVLSAACALIGVAAAL